MTRARPSSGRDSLSHELAALLSEGGLFIRNLLLSQQKKRKVIIRKGLSLLNPIKLKVD